MLLGSSDLGFEFLQGKKGRKKACQFGDTLRG